MDIIDRPSRNHSERRALFLVMHSMALSEAEALDILEGKTEFEGSAHYAISPKGTIYRLVDESRRAWHAGISYWRGIEDINSTSIGIEVINPDPDHRFDRQVFSETHIKAIEELAGDIMARHKIKPCGVVAHQDIAPQRKPDPGKMFPWQKLAQKGIGIWHDIEQYDETRLSGEETETFWQAMGQFGYDTRDLIPENQQHVLRALRTHYWPDQSESNAAPTKGDAAIITALLEKI